MRFCQLNITWDQCGETSYTKKSAWCDRGFSFLFLFLDIGAQTRNVAIANKSPYFSPWSSWSRCSSSCEGGTRVRQRSCIYTHAQSGWQTCHGVTFQAKKCFTKCPGTVLQLLPIVIFFISLRNFVAFQFLHSHVVGFRYVYRC